MANSITVANSGAFAQLISKDYKKVFFDEFKRYPELYKQVANVTSMDSAYDREGQMTGFGALQRLAEGQPIPSDEMLQGNNKVITPDNFGLQFQVSKNLWDDDQTGHIKKAFKELSKAAAYTRELLFWDLFNSGFVTTARVGIDSAALFATHTLPNSYGSYSNVAGTGSSLNMTSLQAARLRFTKMVNDRAIPIPMQPKLLVIPPELEADAERLSLTKHNPENANMEYNWANGLQYLVVPYLTSTTMWALVGDKADHDLRFIVREPLGWRARTTLIRGLRSSARLCASKPTLFTGAEPTGMRGPEHGGR
ncbi:MAG: hypothetical protein HC888_03715 [Candidatus Competibacteraceae bacterium]|nr:hypothetical protein [Candidatus Competibacteraceae bacterium]